MVKFLEKKLSREMRRCGVSLGKIARELKVSKSSVSVWVKDINLSDQQKKILHDNMIAGHVHLHTEETKRKMSKIALDRFNSDPSIGLNLAKGRLKSNLIHRNSEIIVKPYIENYFNTSSLEPCKIGYHYFDFVNDKYIIEYTIDSTSGISDAILRFESILEDDRIKILISPKLNFGKKRLNRLLDTGAIFIPIWFEVTRRTSGSNPTRTIDKKKNV